MRVVILGAGLSGLSCAWHLAQAKVDSVVLEKEADVGGACRTLYRDGFFFDFTGHLLHLRLEESRRLLTKLGLTKVFRTHRRRAGIYLAGRVTPYPIQIHTARLPKAVVRECLLGFIRAYSQPPREAKSFADWVLARFGEGFAHYFFFPYNRKLFCTDPYELTSDWVGRYVPRPALEEVLDGALGLFPKTKAVGYNARFLYPWQGGISVLAERLASGVPHVHVGTKVVAVDLVNKHLVLASGERVSFDAMVATGPLPELAKMSLGLPDALRDEAKKLKAVGVWNLNLAVKGPSLRREHWLYCPEEAMPFYRVGFPSNYGLVAPAGYHTISLEVSVPSGTSPPSGWEETSVNLLIRAGFLRAPEDVIFAVTAVVDPAYVIFDQQRPQVVAALREVFRHHNVHLCGRWAEWKYSTMEDALWDGAALARKLLAR